MSTILTKALAIALVSILMVAMVAPQPAQETIFGWYSAPRPTRFLPGFHCWRERQKAWQWHLAS